MADHLKSLPSSSITALSSTIASRISSGQVLTDPSSVVKELIDNALDARAKSIFVDISVNTIDCIQVKDDGHGIPAEDRPLVCRRHCTSKIRDLHDLKVLGGKWLGFRGEAMSSMAEMSGTLSVTTRVEGEPVAVKLEYGRDGELATTKRDSHPVGTTVKATSFFDNLPVRKQTAIKSSSKLLAKIRRLMQAYALARPAVRFRLHVLKEMNNSSDFIYAPKVGATVQDAVFKVIGKDCALQCDWTTLESDGFEIQAFLPKPSASRSNIANQGAFISVDARPILANRGIAKRAISSVRNKLQTSSSSLGNAKTPFFYINITCPPNSYDVNIEPAKDDVMFGDTELVMGIIEKLLTSHYAQSFPDANELESSASVQTNEDPPLVEPSSKSPKALPGSSDVQTQWRSSMYGIDVDDLEFLQEAPLIIEEQEEGRQAASLSNPWTIMRMNTTNKPKKSYNNNQLPSPAKSPDKATMLPSSPSLVSDPRRLPPSELLTPQTSPTRHLPRSTLDRELEQSIQHLRQISPSDLTVRNDRVETPRQDRNDMFINPTSPAQYPNETFNQFNLGAGSQFSIPSQPQQTFMQRVEYPIASFERPPLSSGPGYDARGQAGRINELSIPGALIPKDAMFNRMVPNLQSPESSQELPQTHNHAQSGPSRITLGARAQNVDTRARSKNDKDIRDFLGKGKKRKNDVCHDVRVGPPFVSFGTQAQPNLLQSPTDTPILRPTDSNQQRLPLIERSRANSVEAYTSSRNGQNEFHINKGRVTEPQDAIAQIRAYAEQAYSLRPWSEGNANSTIRGHTSTNLPNPLTRDLNKGLGIEVRGLQNHSQALEKNFSQPNALQPGSLDSKHPEVLNQGFVKANQLYGRQQSENDSIDIQNMRAQFQRYADKEISLGKQPTTPIRQNNSRAVSTHRRNSKSGLSRRRTTAESQRTKSSRLPLERIPRDHRIHDLTFSMEISVTTIIQRSRKLDMNVNSPEWGYPVHSSYSVFVEFVSERRVMSWATKLDNMLHKQHRRCRGVDTLRQLLAGVQQALDAGRTRELASQSVEENNMLAASNGSGCAGEIDQGRIESIKATMASVQGGYTSCENHEKTTAPAVPQLPTGQIIKEANDEMPEYQLAKLSTLDMNRITSSAGTKYSNDAEETDDYMEDVEDEMLMDL